VPRETVHVGGRDAQAVHPGVDFQVEWNGGPLGAAAGGGLFQERELFAARDGRRQVVVEETLLFAGPEAGKNENRAADTGFADFRAFGGAGDAEPLRASLLQGFGDLRPAVAVAIAFDDREDFTRGFALLPGRIYIGADGMKIEFEGGKRNLRPDGPPDEVYAVHFNCDRIAVNCAEAMRSPKETKFTTFARAEPNATARVAAREATRGA